MHDHKADAQYLNDLKESAPEMVSAFFAFDKAVFGKKTGRLDPLVRELIAVGVAVTTQCNATSALRITPSVPSPQEPPKPTLRRLSWLLQRCAPAVE
jgi:alkylhydroperoxidase/carboxymuconolactone decarboxylase family protein YurZ